MKRRSAWHGRVGADASGVERHPVLHVGEPSPQLLEVGNEPVADDATKMGVEVLLERRRVFPVAATLFYAGLQLVDQALDGGSTIRSSVHERTVVWRRVAGSSVYSAGSSQFRGGSSDRPRRPFEPNGTVRLSLENRGGTRLQHAGARAAVMAPR